MQSLVDSLLHLLILESYNQSCALSLSFQQDAFIIIHPAGSRCSHIFCQCSSTGMGSVLVKQQRYPECWPAIGGGTGYNGVKTCNSGLNCVAQNPYYSQCLSGVGAVKPSSSVRAPTTVAKTSTGPTRSSVPSTGGTTYKASFTHYGAGDTFGSPNCNTNTAACGFYTSPGFSAAASQNM